SAWTQELELEHEVERQALLQCFLERRAEREIELGVEHIRIVGLAQLRGFDGDRVCAHRGKHGERGDENRNSEYREPPPARRAGGGQRKMGSNRGRHAGGRSVERSAEVPSAAELAERVSRWAILLTAKQRVEEPVLIVARTGERRQELRAATSARGRQGEDF